MENQDSSLDPHRGWNLGVFGVGQKRWYFITPRVVLGFTLLLLGTLLTLDNMGVLEVESYWQYWPLFLIMIGLSKVWQPAGASGRGFGVVLSIVGVWILLHNLGFVPFRARYLWPALLIFVGAAMVWRGFGSGRVTPAAKDSGSTVHALAVLGGVERRSSSQTFLGGDANAILGGCEIDLRKASISGTEAVIDCFAMWGGIDIKVPEDWTVSVQGIPLLGAFNDRTNHPKESTSKTLVVRGMVIMGGVEIKN